MADSIEELEANLAQAKTLREKIDALNALAWELRHDQVERVLSLSQKAYELSSSDEFAEHPYIQGQATSLTTQGFMHHKQGKLDAALSQCLEAAALMESLPPSRVYIDSQRIISWTYYYLGDIANALVYGLKALRLAQDLKFKIQEASVLDGLAIIYTATHDLKQALSSQEEALQIARDAGEEMLETVVLNNMAITLLEMGNLVSALDSGLKSVQLARQLNHKEHVISSLDTVGQVLLKMGDYSRAEQVLQEGLTLAVQSNLELGQVYCLLNLGKNYLAQHNLDSAGDLVRKALDIAYKVGTRSIQSECHLTLSQIYEQQGNFKEALEHYKMFFALHQEINSEEAGKQVAALKVIHHVETAERDAEIYRLRNVELQNEIQERARIEAELERLATVDSLTNIFNRRHFFDLTQREFDRAIRYGRPLTMLMIDIDDFKKVNDTYGHATGDQVLVLFSALINCSLRKVDILGRYGGEEFCIVMPETNMEQGIKVAERIRQSVEQQRFMTSSGEVSVTISVGMTSLSEGARVVQGTLDKLINQADQAVYIAKKTGRNRVEIAQEG